MAHVDALSRQIFYLESLPIERELEFRQLQDSRLKEIARELEYADNNKFELIEGQCIRKVPTVRASPFPKQWSTQLLERITTTWHIVVLRKHIRTYKKYIGSHRCVSEYAIISIIALYVCLMANASPYRFEGELQIDSSTKTPFEVLHIDHFGPLQETANGYKYILVIIDAFTRYTWLFPTKSTTTKEVCNNLQLLFNVFSIPKEIVSDRGTAFASAEFATFLSELNIKLRKVAVASPWANGIVERVNRFIKSSLTKLVESPHEWQSQLNTVQYVINNTSNSTVKTSPSKLLFGFHQRNHADRDLKELTNVLANIDNNFDEQRTIVRDLAIDAIEKLRQYNRTYYDNKHEIPTKYKAGAYVLVRDLQTTPGVNKKLKPKYKGPYIKF